MSEVYQPKLKPCPFCGGEAFYKYSEPDENYPDGCIGVYCSLCSEFTGNTISGYDICIFSGIIVRQLKDKSVTELSVAQLWNRRAGGIA